MFGQLSWRRFFSGVLLFVLVAGLQPAAPAQAQPAAQSGADQFVPAPAIITADPQVSDLRVLAPLRMQSRSLASTSSVVVDFLPAGSDAYGYTCETFPAEAQAALTYAADIWGALLKSNVTIMVQVCWAALGSNVLGMTGATSVRRNFTNAPQANTYYSVALANALSGTDLNGSQAEIMGVYSDGVSYYYGTEGTPSIYQYDMVSLALHEIAHGLGFSGSMDVSGGSGSWGYGGSNPTIYDRFTVDGNNKLLISYDNPSTSLGDALQGNAGGVYFRGPNAVAANGGSQVKLYSPSSWQGGSSYSHLSTTFDHTVNALMTYSLAAREVVHDPGPVAIGMMKDFGWSVNAMPAAPSDLTAAAVSPSQINLSWTDNSVDETGFKIERSTDQANWTLIHTNAANSAVYSDTGLQPGTKYFYRVRASNLFGDSSNSALAYAVTQGPPPAPSNLAALAIGTDRILLSWTINDNIGSAFIIEKSTTGGNPWNPVATTGAGASSATITGLDKNTPNYFRVKAHSSNGDSGVSNVAAATTWLKSYPSYEPAIMR